MSARREARVSRLGLWIGRRGDKIAEITEETRVGEIVLLGEIVETKEKERELNS